MVVKKILPGGTKIIEPPFTSDEVDDFYARQGVAQMIKGTPGTNIQSPERDRSKLDALLVLLKEDQSERRSVTAAKRIKKACKTLGLGFFDLMEVMERFEYYAHTKEGRGYWRDPEVSDVICRD